ncbi:MAG: hypothetical protein BZY88_20565 [SAR202 cluster bacterium Io17-Chloro-G9]|nr:MAG: hypothetical protein BZY88_20565 [SAR202 cluster bacterium Io17-Chloro-G9]
MSSSAFFDVYTPLGFRVRANFAYWQIIVRAKHPVMEGRESIVQEVLRFPDEIRQSRRDSDVYLFYRAERPDRWTCVVVKRQGDDGFLITTYPTDGIKEGTAIWTK